MINVKLFKWLANQRKTQTLIVKQVSLNKLQKWNVNKNEICHVSKKFFRIIGIRIRSNFYKKNWDQPIIYQNEI